MSSIERYQPLFIESNYPPPPGEQPAPSKQLPSPAPPPAPIQPVPVLQQRTKKGRPPKPKRKPGAPKGNTNALKHGLYVHHMRVRNTNPIDKASLYNLTEHIKALKTYLLHLYEFSLKSTDLGQVNDATRSLSLGSLALCRLINIHEEFSALPLPDDLLGIDYTDESFRPDEYEDPSLEEIEDKLKELGA